MTNNKDKRKFDRKKVRFLILDENKRRLGKMKNLSIMGMAFYSKRKLDIDDKIDIKILLPNENFKEYKKQKPLELKFLIVHKDKKQNEKYLYGGKFINIKSYQINKIKKALKFMFFKRGKYTK